MKTLPRDKDGYIPGSIVRIQLRNFVTYDFAEFRPGPYLNMIIGPNGTGKSSIACAICLGLNWPPSILGRANEINAFVKGSTDSGHIEIELKGPAGESNLIIRRNLVSKNKTSTFTLNGNSATGKEISDRMQELNVQVGNLCSFLPQDKVSEFAAMSPQQLLKETQRAAGDRNLSDWHQTLIEEGKELRAIQELLKSDLAQLQQWRDKNERVEKEVQRVREKEEIEHMILLLELLLSVQIYRETRVAFFEIKRVQRKLHEKVQQERDKNGAAHELLKKQQADAKKLEKERDELKKTTQAKFGKMSKVLSDGEEIENQTEEANTSLENLARDEKNRSKKIGALEAEIKKVEEQLSKPVKIEDDEEGLKQEFHKITLERRDVQKRQAELNGELTTNTDQLSRLESAQRVTQQKLASLDNVDTQKLQFLATFDKDTHDVVCWLRANKDKFKEPIIEPPVLTVTVRPTNGRLDPALVTAVEGCFSFNQLKSFVAQNHDDYNTFNRLVQDGNAIGRQVRVTIWYRAPKPNLYIEPPMPADELKAMGFDGYALDFITYPPGMLWFLQCDIQLHRTAVALKAEAIDVQRTMEVVGRSGGANFVTGKTMHQVGRSRYGQKHVQNITRELRQGQVLKGVKVDENVKNTLLTEMKQHGMQLDIIRAERAEIDSKLDTVSKEDEVFNKRVAAINERKKKIVDHKQNQIKLSGTLKRYQTQLKGLKEAPSLDQEKARFKKRLADLSLKRVKLVKEYTGLANSVVSEQRGATQVGLKFLQICANRAALQVQCDKKEEKYKKIMAEFEKADNDYQAAKVKSKEALVVSQAAVNDAADDLVAEYKAIANARSEYEDQVKAGRNPSPDGVDLRTADELRQELENQRAKLTGILETNPGVVEQYEHRKQLIETLEKTVEDRQKKAERIERRIKHARDNWKPALEKLVESIGSRFSAAFDRIGCAGEIRISENDDYDKWAIDILVKFRDDEKLQLLTGQRQSGGERSLTTILYLMALTEEARAPFSLVDEINQGMDQRAERVVHNSMVEVTCKEDSAQYFLITPKLLADLNYHERMKILCVNNGEWLPEERGIGNLKSMLDGYVAHRG